MRILTGSLLLALILPIFTLAGSSLTAMWDFSTGSFHSTNGKFLMLPRGKTLAAGGALVVVPPGKDTPEGIIAREVYPHLSPKGAFRFKAVFSIEEYPGKKQNILHLWDSSYVTYKSKDSRYNRGFNVLLFRNRGKETFSPCVFLGFGPKGSLALYGKPFQPLPGKKYTLAFDYDGLDTLKLFFGGKLVSSKKFSPAPGGISPAFFKAVIGARGCSTHTPFSGKIFLIELSEYRRPALLLRFTGRRSFKRDEKAPALSLELKKILPGKVTDLKLFSCSGEKKRVLLSREVFPASGLEFALPVKANLLPGSYRGKLLLEYKHDSGRVTKEYPYIYHTAPVSRELMPVIAADGFRLDTDFSRLRKLGFNQVRFPALSQIFFKTLTPEATEIEKRFQVLDDLYRMNMRMLDPSYYPITLRERFPRYDKEGKIIRKHGRKAASLDASHPEVFRKTRAVTRAVALTFGKHPAFAGASINEEQRDSTAPTYSGTAPEAFRKFAKFPIPKELGRYDLIRETIPFSGIVGETNPLFIYYRWFWKDGDGWNPLNSMMSEIYHKYIRHPFETEFAPAVRTPPLWGSGGKVDLLTHWTYANPNPVRVSTGSSELQAMAAEDGRRSANHVQLILYRSASAPIGEKVKDPPPWLKKAGNAGYISIAPDMLKIAVWMLAARKTDRFQFHGLNSLLPGITPHMAGYFCTLPELETIFRELIREVVQGLAPITRYTRERPAQVVVLESFASCVIGGKGSWGWTGWGWDLTTALHWANLMPGIVYEETILRDKLANVKVLILPDVCFLPEKVFRIIREFQKKGGIIVGDEELVPGILPDVTIRKHKTGRDVKKDKYALRQLALEIRKKLAPVYTPYTGASDPDLVTWVRKDGSADYLFVINDRRDFGNYIGMWRKIMEKGSPNSGSVHIRKKAGKVYDLLTHKEVPFRSIDGVTGIPVNFSSSGGRAFLVVPRALPALKVQVPGEVQLGRKFSLQAELPGVDFILPLKITLLDPAGRKSDESGVDMLRKGKFSREMTLPENAPQGIWKLEIRESASGSGGVFHIRVKK